MNRMKAFCAVIFVAMSLGAGAGNAQVAPARFVPFHDFLETTKAASFFDHAALPETRVEEAAAFEEMRQHILAMYEGVHVTHSFVLASDHYDCVPTAQQPSVRLLGLKEIASPPPPLPEEGSSTNEGLIQSATQFGVENFFDEFGNSTACEGDTVSLRRVTLEEMTRFPTLRRFFQKSPNESVPGDGHDCVDVENILSNHRYALTCQFVHNLGGNSALNLPPKGEPEVTTEAGEIFSLSQEWYVGGSGPERQTAEVGWVVWPQKFGDENARLFIYWTRDGYKTTGCWNTDCKGFVQIPGYNALGGAWKLYSVPKGTQYEFQAQYYIYEGNMWLALNGVWVGYYPKELYNGGQLTKYATFIEFGSETYSKTIKGTTIWAPQGTGQWSKEGFGKATYQRNLYYIDSSGIYVWDSLTKDEPFPECYTITGPSAETGVWQRYFYEGGPGCLTYSPP